MRLNLAILGFGACFGFVLGWAHLDDPDVIQAMLLLREPDVFLVMGLAIATASVGVRLLKARRVRALLEGSPVGWRTVMPTRDHVIGSALFGLGWSVTSACPGPIAVQIGRGVVSAAFTAVGLMTGIAIRDALRARAARPPQATVESASRIAIEPGLGPAAEARTGG